MNKFVTIGLGAAAVVVLVFLGAQLFGSPSGGPGLGGEPTATAEPTATPAPSPSPPASAPPLTQSFTSTLHGFSVSYPEGWTAQAATEPWTDDTFPLFFGDPHADFLYDPALTSDLFLTIASQPIGDSTPEDWVAEQMASDEGCTATEPITVDGATGLIGAATARGGRHNRWPRLLDPALCVWRRRSPSLPTTGPGSRRSLPRCSSSPRTPSTEGRAHHVPALARGCSRLVDCHDGIATRPMRGRPTRAAHVLVAACTAKCALVGNFRLLTASPMHSGSRRDSLPAGFE